MMLPPPASAIRGATSPADLTGPFTLTAKSLSKKSLVMSSITVRAGLMPALLISTSEPSELGVDPIGQGGQAIPVAEMTRQAGERPSAGRFPDLGGHPVAQLGLAAHDHDVAARLGQSLHDGPAEALGGAGDQ